MSDENRALRAQHTCVLSSMNCRACHDGVPYPALTPDEVQDALRQGREEAEQAYSALFGRPGRCR